MLQIPAAFQAVLLFPKSLTMIGKEGLPSGSDRIEKGMHAWSRRGTIPSTDSSKIFPFICATTFELAQPWLHVQPGIELNLTLGGQGTFVVDKLILGQSPGQLLLFPGRLPH